MAWSAVPVSTESRASVAAMNEVRAAIVERQDIVGGTNPGTCAAEDRFGRLAEYRTAIQTLIPLFRNPADWSLWTVSALLTATIGQSAWTDPALGSGTRIKPLHVNEMRLALNGLLWIGRYADTVTYEDHGSTVKSNAVWDTAWTAAKADEGSSTVSDTYGVYAGRGYLSGATYYAALKRRRYSHVFSKAKAVGGSLAAADLVEWRVSCFGVSPPSAGGQNSSVWGGSALFGSGFGGSVWQTDVAERADVIVVTPPLADFDLGAAVWYWGDETNLDDYKPVTPTVLLADNKGHRMVAGSYYPWAYLHLNFAYVA